MKFVQRNDLSLCKLTVSDDCGTKQMEKMTVISIFVKTTQTTNKLSEKKFLKITKIKVTVT